MKQTLKIGFVVMVVAALVTSGIALAQTGDETVADDAPASRIMERLSPLVADGTLNQAQAEAVAEVLADGIGIRGGGPGRPDGPRGGHGAGPEAVAGFLRLTTDELRAAHEDGSNLAEIAEANGSSRSALVDFLVGEAEARLDQAVEDGRIDETDKAEKLAEITERINQMVDGELEAPAHGPGRGERGGPGGPRDNNASQGAGANL